jgi:hypothetical protein
MALLKTVGQVTIPNGTALSNPIDLGAKVLCAIIVPSAWTAAGLSFQASDDGGATWFNIYDSTGTEAVVGSGAVVAGRRISLDPSLFAGVDFIRVRSGTSGVPVNQAADRVASLVSVDSSQAFGIKSAGGAVGTQTPWATDIDGATHKLTNASSLTTLSGVDSGGLYPTGLLFQTSGTNRWFLNKSNAETGGNAGSDYVLTCYDDAGGFLRNSLQINRVNGAIVWNGPAFSLVGLPSVAPAAGSKQLWYDPADGNRVKYVP